MTMTTMKAWMTVVVISVVVVIDGSTSLDIPSTIGNDFVFGIPSDYVYRRSSSKRVFLSSQSGQTVTATIVTSGSNFRHVVEVPGDRELRVDLPRSLTSRGTGLKQNVVGIRADGDLSVHVQIEAGVNSGAFTPLPTGSLGNDYIVGIYEPLTLKHTKYKAGFTVTATEAGALIKIRFSQVVAFGHVYYGPDDFFKFQLGSYESLQIMSDKDLTGSRIKSDRPVAVVTGSECSRVPRGIKYCDYLVEQMPPVHTLGKQFIVAPFKDRESSYVLRIVAPFNDTNIIFSSPHANDVHLNENQHHEFIFTRHVDLSFRSTEPVLVLQFMKGFQSGDFVGDPSMVVIPPVEQFIVGDLSLTSMDNDHVTVMVTNSNVSLSGLRVNGNFVGRDSPDWRVIVEDDVSSVLHGTLQSGRHTIGHTDPQARFLVIGYGTGYLSGRAFPVAYYLKRLYVPSTEPLFIPPRGYEVQCYNSSMSITLDTSVFLVHGPDDVTLNDPSCKHVIIQKGIIMLTTPFDSCDTRVQEQGDTVTFSNTLRFADSVITPDSPLRYLSFKCESTQAGISGISSLTGGRREPSALVLSDAVLGDLSLSLVQYMDDTFGTSSNASSGTDLFGTWMEGVQPGQEVFAVNLTSSVDASVFVDSCWTTPGPEAQDQDATSLIQDGCEIDDTIHIGASADDPRFRPIAVDSFSPIGEYNEVFMHCRVQVCRGQESAAHCWQECRREPRKRRDIRGVREMHTISTGPIKIK